MTRLTLLHLLLSVSLSAAAAQAQERGRPLLSLEALEKAAINLGPAADNPYWAYHPGDDEGWASPMYDDSGWMPASSVFDEEVWQGIGWFRLAVRVDSTLWDRPLAAIIDQRGAAEVYLNGTRIYALGRVGVEGEEITFRDKNPRLFTFAAMQEQLIAVRYSNMSASSLTDYSGRPDFNLSFDDMDRAVVDRVDRIVRLKNYQRFFLGALFIFTLLHLLLFLFNRTTRHNLDFAAFTGALAALVFVNFQQKFAAELDAHQILERLWRITVLAVAVLGMRVIYHLFCGSLPRQYGIIAAVAAFFALASWFNTELLHYVYVLALVVSFELLRVIIVTTLTKNQPKMWIITAGTAVWSRPIFS